MCFISIKTGKLGLSKPGPKGAERALGAPACSMPPPSEA